MAFKDGDTVYYRRRPYVIIRLDSAEHAELYAGLSLNGVKLRSKDRGTWAKVSELTKRDGATVEEAALDMIWRYVQDDDWSSVVGALEAYGDLRKSGGRS